MNSCKYCGREGRFYREQPEGYIESFEWAEKMMKTHHQERCPTPECGRWTVWKLGPPQKWEKS